MFLYDQPFFSVVTVETVGFRHCNFNRIIGHSLGVTHACDWFMISTFWLVGANQWCEIFVIYKMTAKATPKRANPSSRPAGRGAKKTKSKTSILIKPKRVKAKVARAVKNKEPKLVENTKQLLVLRGNKTSEEVNALLRDLKMMKAPDAKVLSKRNDLHPFEDANSVEFLTQKNDASLFLLGSHTKKRPNNLIIGRTFDGHIMDMMELGFENFRSIDDFKCKSKMAPGSKPCFVFAGAEWETTEEHMKLKNILLDMFRGTITTSVNVKGLDHVIVCSAARNNRVLFRHYSIDFKLSHDTVRLHCLYDAT
jgi:ribosome production factor 2